MIRVNEIKFDVDETFTEVSLKEKVIKKMRAKESEVKRCIIVRESIDARKSVIFSYVVDVEVLDEMKWIRKGFVKSPERYIPKCQSLSEDEMSFLKSQNRPVVIGFGPAGMFAALYLAYAGLNPLVFEMGEDVDQRTKSVELFWEKGLLNLKSNVQFGEGGAGTFSDGKLTTRIKDDRVEWVLNVLIEAGAPVEIGYKNKPHIGTDILKNVVKSIRKKVIDLGGEVHFKSEVTDFIMEDTSIKGVVLSDGKTFKSSQIIAATGHSSRDFYEKLISLKFELEQKPFAVGVRIEHPQKLINASQYGSYHSRKRLGAAEYKLTYTTSKGRSVYSFCMCPGGEVVASASEEGRLVVNGMSYYKRDLDNANSALLVNVNPEDYGPDLKDGIEFQRRLEEMAYTLGGGDFVAPVQTVGGFLGSGHIEEYNRNHSEVYHTFGLDYNAMMDGLSASYRPKVKEADLKALLPDFVAESLVEALPKLGQKIKGFDDPRAILTGIESRSSSPLRVLRDALTYESLSHRGFFPCGEGAGYAGGITSSAVDGIKVAESVVEQLLKNYPAK